jgi:hypothetical protein
MTAESRLPLDELVRLRVRRGVVQCLVRDAYQATVADQDREHRRPREFTQAWRANLASALDSADVDLSGCGPAAFTAADIDLAWKLHEAASRGREEALGHVKMKHSQLTRMGSLKVPIFEISVTSEGGELGAAKYGTCYPCGVGLLQKISFDPDWQFCGLGRLTLNELEARHPSLTWYTTAQYKDARGFYERYRQNSSSPWTDKQHPCLHFD